MSVFNYQKDQQGIVTITMDMTGPVNAMNAEYKVAMHDAVNRLEQEQGLVGVILASAKRVFFAGADLKDLVRATPDHAEEIYRDIQFMKHDMRRLEKLPVPVVAAINGAALGGGYELSLACNRRIAVNHRAVKIGLTECSLGLFPAGGGIVRLTHLIGVQAALDIILGSKQMIPEKALAVGMIDQLVETLDDLIPAAKRWLIDVESEADAARQPWDRKGQKVAGGAINTPKNAQYAAVAPTMLHQKTRGLLPNATAAMDIAFQASMLDVDTALRIESREFVKVVTGAVAKNMITTFFFQLNQINAGASRPQGVAKNPTRKLGILGAGMMGQGIAYVAAMAGIQVVLKDMTLAAAEKGKAYTIALLAKQTSRGRLDAAKAEVIADLIKPTICDTDLAGCDLIIEAVFENIALKNTITQSTEQYLSDDGHWGSNTSTLPITQLAEASAKPENFIGIHFFSPVDKMPLIEIIAGEKTSDATLAKAFDFAQQIGKTPIVVNDSLGFFTSRTFSTYLDEGAKLLVEGVHPVKIENLAKATGMAVGPLQVQDETSLELSRKVSETWAAMGIVDKWGDGETQRRMIKDMITDNGRGGRHHGGGYYDYHADGSKSIWPGLFELYYDDSVEVVDRDIQDRLMFRQVIETLKCYQTGVLRSVADGNIGSIMGIGAPAHTGGFIQFVNSYGCAAFIQRCEELSAAYGERFNCPEIVKQRAASGELFA
jgi:3-hydroxyacyl-CoA dehydrogenase/enoyl-CoA hydratase/3-hydroxybutyryl-CoA epimerase